MTTPAHVGNKENAMKYRKKPVVIEAHQYDGARDSASTIIRWAHAGLPDAANAIVLHDGHQMRIRTLEGMMIASPGDFIIRGVRGELYPCKPDIFAATYERADAPDPTTSIPALLRVAEAARMALGSLKHDAEANNGRGYHQTINTLEQALSALPASDERGGA